MGLFDSPWRQLEAFLQKQREAGRLRELPLAASGDWPEEQSLVLEEDTAIELGKPDRGSLSFLLWREDGEERDRVLLVGPDLDELPSPSEPFGQIVLVRGRFEDEYECFRELRDAVYQTRLRGFMTRVLPSRQTIWARVNREARERGFSLAHLGAALVRNLKQSEFVSAASVVFIVSSREDLRSLEGAGREAARIAGAMLKMSEEMNFDCRTCEYADVCDEVAELKTIRQRLAEKKSR